MTKKKLIDIIQSILNTDIDLRFLLQLQESELAIVAACIRDRISHIDD